jgi:uncharacterized protein (TIGR02996 family)
MTERDALLAGIISEPSEETRWLVPADWLEENDDPRRAELLRLHRQLLATSCEPGKHPERATQQARILELIAEGVQPCVPQKTLELPGGLTLTGSFIPPGSFLMGGTFGDYEKPVHKVTCTIGFFLGIHPVTQSQWKAVMGTEPSRFKGPNRPVERVSWDDCQEFCKKLTEQLNGTVTVRLPTEAEWEYACRAGTTTEYWFGDVINPDLANYDGNQQWNGSPKGKNRKQTTDVGSVGTRNPCGLSDVHGNVWEWCQDAWDEAFYARSPSENPICTNDQAMYRTLRGGSWINVPRFCRSAFRYGDSSALGFNYIGFRVYFRPDG